MMYMYLNNYCTDVMFLVVTVYVIYSFTILSLINFKFPLVFKISLMFVEMSTGFNYEMYSLIPTNGI